MQEDMSTQNQSQKIQLKQQIAQQTSQTKQSQIEKMIEKQTKLNCIKNNNVVFLCSTQGCNQSGLICGDNQCQCLKIHDHELCETVTLKSIEKFLKSKKKQMPYNVQKGFDEMLQIYQNYIQKLSVDKHHLELIYQYYGMTLNEAKVLDYLKNQNSYALNGDLLNNVCFNKEKIKDYEGFDYQWMQNYWQAQTEAFNDALNKISHIIYSTRFKDLNQKSWDLIHRHENLVFRSNTVTAKSENLLILINKKLSFKKSFVWKLKYAKHNKTYMKVGIYAFNSVVKNNYQINKKDDLYMISNDGYSYCKQNWGTRNTNILINQEDIIQIMFFPALNRLQFKKQNSTTVYTFQIKELKKGYFSPCVQLSSEAQIQIISTSQ